MAHGRFEAESAVCPNGCSVAIERAFFTAPGIASPRTRNIDATLKTLARDYGYSDLSNKNGTVANGRGNPFKDSKFAPSWRPVAKGDVFKSGGVIEKREGSEGGAAASAKAERIAPVAGEISFSDIAKVLPAPRASVDPKLKYGDASTLQAAVKSVSA